MISGFKSKALKKLFESGVVTKGINPQHADKLIKALDQIHADHTLKTLKIMFGPRLREKKGGGEGVHSIDISGNWRLTFELTGDERGAVLVDYCDYHGKQIKAKS